MIVKVRKEKEKKRVQHMAWNGGSKAYQDNKKYGRHIGGTHDGQGDRRNVR